MPGPQLSRKRSSALYARAGRARPLHSDKNFHFFANLLHFAPNSAILIEISKEAVVLW